MGSENQSEGTGGWVHGRWKEVYGVFREHGIGVKTGRFENYKTKGSKRHRVGTEFRTVVLHLLTIVDTISILTNHQSGPVNPKTG